MSSSDVLPEPVPVVVAHVDEELLTRQKYFSENLAKREADAASKRIEQERKMRSQRREDEETMRAKYEERLRKHERDLFEQRSWENRQREQEIHDEQERLRRLQVKQRKEQDDIEARTEKGQKDRALAEWIDYNKREGAAFETQEEQSRQRVLESARAKADADLKTLKDLHEKNIEQISIDASLKAERWKRSKPILVAAFLGGAFGLIMTPSM